MSDFADEDIQRGRNALPQSFLLPSEVAAVLAAVLPEYRKRVRAEALREAADVFTAMQADPEQMDPWYWTDSADILCVRADAEESK